MGHIRTSQSCWLQEPEQYVSGATAELLAQAAYRRAAQLAPLGVPLVGVGATCALATVGHAPWWLCNGS